MNNDTGPDQAWVQLIREVIASWPLLLGAVVLVLVSTPAVVAVAVVAVVLLAAWWSAYVLRGPGRPPRGR